MSRSLLLVLAVDLSERDGEGDPWPFNCESRVSIGIGDGGGKWKRRDAHSPIIIQVMNDPS